MTKKIQGLLTKFYQNFQPHLMVLISALGLLRYERFFVVKVVIYNSASSNENPDVWLKALGLASE